MGWRSSADPSHAQRGRVARCKAARRVGALSGTAPHPSAWLRQSATLPFEKGRDQRLTRCVNLLARKGRGVPSACRPPESKHEKDSIEPYLIPASISGTSVSIVFGVTTPAPVFSASPGILYFAVITH